MMMLLFTNTDELFGTILVYIKPLVIHAVVCVRLSCSCLMLVRAQMSSYREVASKMQGTAKQVMREET